MRLTTATAFTASLLAIITSAALAATTWPWWAIIIITILAALIPLAAINGQTLPERVLAWRRSHRIKHGLNCPYEQNDAAVTWGGGDISTYIQITPTPFMVTTLNDETTLPTLPMTTLTKFLNRSGINLAGIRVITNGYATPDDSYLAQQYADMLPEEVRPPITHTTVLQVNLKLARSLAAIYRRMTTDSVPMAAGKAAWVAAARIVRALSRARISSHIMTLNEIRDFQDRVLDSLNDGILHETATLGAGEHLTSRSYIASRLGLASLAESYTPAVTLTSTWNIQGTTPNNATIQACATAAAADPELVTPPDTGRWYPPSYMQVDIQTHALPMAVTVELPGTPTHILDDTADDLIPRYGAGIYLGDTDNGDSVFLNTETGGKVLWMLGAEWHLQSLIARLALTGTPIYIRVDAMHSFINVLDLDHVRQIDATQNPTNGILIIDSEHEDPRTTIPSDLAVIAFNRRTRPEAAHHCIYPQTESQFVIRSLSQQETFTWRLGAAEVSAIRAAREVAASRA